MSELLVCRQLSKSFTEAGRQIIVLNNIELQITAGEMLAITGASGAGKSTLLHLMGGLDKPSSGEVIVMGRSLHRLTEKAKSALRNQHLGFIYQFHHLLAEFNAIENVSMPLLIRGVKHKVALETAALMLKRVELDHRLTHRVSELSGGERQRVAIARALVTRPACVLADEPTGNLDQQTANHVFDLMLSLNHELQTSFIVVTHNELLAQKMNRILQLKDGQLS